MVLVEVSRKPYLASMVPVIVNAILNEHQIIVDIVAFVNKGDFPRSRLGEKQRGKLLAGWVTRKMRTLAQFAIRDDVDPAAMGADGVDANRASMVSTRSYGGPSSLRRHEQAPKIMEQEEFEQQMDQIANMTPASTPMGMGGDAPRPQQQPSPQPPQPAITTHAYVQPQQATYGYEPPHSSHGYDLSDIDRFGTPDAGPPQVGPKPGSAAGPKPESRSSDGQASSSNGGQASRFSEGQAPPQIRLPGVDGREGFDFWGNSDAGEQSWEADAIMHMNLTGDMHSPGSGHAR